MLRVGRNVGAGFMIDLLDNFRVASFFVGVLSVCVVMLVVSLIERKL